MAQLTDDCFAFSGPLLPIPDMERMIAERVLKAAVSRDRENPFAWHQLGMVYAANGDLARARLASAEQQSLSNRMSEALNNAEAAGTELPRGSSDWLRAQDIAMHARAAIERDRKRR